MIRKQTPEERLISRCIREQIGRSLKAHYQARMTDELPLRLREVLKKLDENLKFQASMFR